MTASGRSDPDPTRAAASVVSTPVVSSESDSGQVQRPETFSPRGLRSLGWWPPATGRERKVQGSQ